MLKHITNVADFDAAVKEGKVLVDFYADWCGPCKMLAPILEKVANDHPEIDVVKVNTDEVPELAGRYRISAIPTLLAYQDGKIVNQAMGYMPENSVLRLLGL